MAGAPPAPRTTGPVFTGAPGHVPPALAKGKTPVDFEPVWDFGFYFLQSKQSRAIRALVSVR